MTRRLFYVGDPVPKFTCRTTNHSSFHFDSVAGRYVVLSFFGSAHYGSHQAVLDYIATELRPQFNDVKLCFFGVSIDPADEAENRMTETLPGLRYFWDFNGNVSKGFGALDSETEILHNAEDYQSFTLVLDPFLRVIATIHMDDAEQHNKALAKQLSMLPSLDDYAAVPINAPVLILPRVLEPQFCKELIELYDTQGGTESGTMSERNGYTIGKIDHNFKRRKDFGFETTPEHEEIRAALRARITRRITPEIYKAFQFEVTLIERYIVACYEGEVGGFFRAHRDNTTKGTAHRRFACTINLNAEDYEGGDLRFPEFGTRTYRAPTGGAVIFSCSLLHEATPVTRGRRYAFLPFFYDDAAAKIRDENRKFLTGETIVKT